MKKPFYITSAIPYVNASPHIGFAMELCQTDAIYRYHKALLSEDALLLSGADENALKNVQAAEKAGKPVQEFVDDNSKEFEKLGTLLNIHIDVFQKGSNQKTHVPSSQELWKRCQANGDIYKKEYTGLYCVGCELFYSPDELNENGECFEHPGKKLEEVSETNYFFKLSAYQARLIKLIESDDLWIVPETRKNEMLSFLKQPLQDISISRSNERAKNWGVPVPGDDAQRMYVWFDALNIYQSGVGFGWNDEMYKKYWPADVHVIGKGITRFHAIYWPAFLMSAQLDLPKTLFVHGYITSEGQKMSKSLGNVVDPVDVITRYGSESVRYYLLREIPAYSDGDFSEERFKELYNADLANGLGNLVSRVTTLAEKHAVEMTESETTPLTIPSNAETGGFTLHMERFEFNLALEELWKEVRNLDVTINKDEPWKRSGDEVTGLLKTYIKGIRNIAYALQPFMPETSTVILDSTQGTVTKVNSLFPRLIK